MEKKGTLEGSNFVTRNYTLNQENNDKLLPPENKPNRNIERENPKKQRNSQSETKRRGDQQPTISRITKFSRKKKKEELGRNSKQRDAIEAKRIREKGNP